MKNLILLLTVAIAMIASTPAHATKFFYECNSGAYCFYGEVADGDPYGWQAYSSYSACQVAYNNYVRQRSQH